MIRPLASNPGFWGNGPGSTHSLSCIEAAWNRAHGLYQKLGAQNVQFSDSKLAWLEALLGTYARPWPQPEPSSAWSPTCVHIPTMIATSLMPPSSPSTRPPSQVRPCAAGGRSCRAHPARAKGAPALVHAHRVLIPLQRARLEQARLRCPLTHTQHDRRCAMPLAPGQVRHVNLEKQRVTWCSMPPGP